MESYAHLEVSWFTGLSLSNNLNEMYLPKAATA
jgi:hypothetical protein